MPSNAEIESKLWKALKSDRTMMIGLPDADDADSQPMTAALDGDAQRGPIYFFTAKDTDLVRDVGAGAKASAQFVSKGHDVFATLHGRLAPDNDRATIDRLWNKFVAAWYEGGKDDPKLQLLRFDATQAKIWLNEHSLVAGVKLLLGSDPKDEYADKVAEVRLN